MKHQHKSHPLKYFNLDFSYLSGIIKLIKIFGTTETQKSGGIIDLDDRQLEELDPRNPTVQTDQKSEFNQARNQEKSSNIMFCTDFKVGQILEQHSSSSSFFLP